MKNTIFKKNISFEFIFVMDKYSLFYTLLIQFFIVFKFFAELFQHF